MVTKQYLEEQIAGLQKILDPKKASDVQTLIELQTKLIEMEAAELQRLQTTSIFSQPWVPVLLAPLLGAALGLGTYQIQQADKKEEVAAERKVQLARERAERIAQEARDQAETAKSNREMNFKILELVAGNSELLFSKDKGRDSRRLGLIDAIRVVGNPEVVVPIFARMTATLTSPESVKKAAEVVSGMGLTNAGKVSVTVRWIDGASGLRRGDVQQALAAQLALWGVRPENVAFEQADSTPPSLNDVRYYHSEDAGNAGVILAFLKQRWPEYQLNLNARTPDHDPGTVRLYLRVTK